MPASPLDGLRVLEFAQIAAGPTCGMMLGDMGADVIKIEPPSGDLGRWLGPPWLNGESVVFLSLNRNKRSVVIDLKKPGGTAVVGRMAKRCDVVIESFRPEVADRLGIGYDALSLENPGIVYCSISAYGQTGPWRAAPGVDGIVQATSGLMSIIGTADGPPCKVQAPVVDMVTGFLATVAVLAALRSRDNNGIGQKLDVNMYNSALMLQQVSLCSYLASGQLPARIGSAAPYAAPNEALPTRDGWIMVAAYQQERWLTLSNLLGRADLAEDPRFVDSQSRVRHRTELVATLGEIFGQRSTAEWLRILQDADIICGPIATYDQVVTSAQMRHGALLVDVEHPVAGKVSMPRFGLGFSATPSTIRLPPPLLGQHTVEILSSFDFQDEEIGRLCEAEVVTQWKSTETAVMPDKRDGE